MSWGDIFCGITVLVAWLCLGAAVGMALGKAARLGSTEDAADALGDLFWGGR